MAHRHGLQKDNQGFVDVYADGACLKNGFQGARAGSGVWFGDNHSLNVSQPLSGRQTNQRAELQSVTAACKQALNAGIDNVRIHTDSDYTIKCATNWRQTWENNGYKNYHGHPVTNRADIVEMNQALDQINHEFVKVPAHSGIYGNVKADELAKGAANY